MFQNNSPKAGKVFLSPDGLHGGKLSGVLQRNGLPRHAGFGFGFPQSVNYGKSWNLTTNNDYLSIFNIFFSQSIYYSKFSKFNFYKFYDSSIKQKSFSTINVFWLRALNYFNILFSLSQFFRFNWKSLMIVEYFIKFSKVKKNYYS